MARHNAWPDMGYESNYDLIVNFSAVEAWVASISILGFLFAMATHLLFFLKKTSYEMLVSPGADYPLIGTYHESYRDNQPPTIDPVVCSMVNM